MAPASAHTTFHLWWLASQLVDYKRIEQVHGRFRWASSLIKCGPNLGPEKRADMTRADLRVWTSAKLLLEHEWGQLNGLPRHTSGTGSLGKRIGWGSKHEDSTCAQSTGPDKQKRHYAYWKAIAEVPFYCLFKAIECVSEGGYLSICIVHELAYALCSKLGLQEFYLYMC